MTANPFLHVELQTSNPEAARRFYGALFAWRMSDVAGMDYAMIAAGGETGGGIMASADGSSRWIPFVRVDDVPGSTERARSLGATVIKGPAQAKGYGWYSVMIDPTGATFGIWNSHTG